MLVLAAATLTVTSAALVFSFADTNECNVIVDSKSKDKFLTYAKQKDIEVVYLRTTFTNETNEPSFGEDISSIYDPLGWSWSASQQGNAILSLPYDYKILSCSTLSRETRYMSFRIVSRPPDCFAKLNPKQQFDELVKLLLTTTQDLSANSSVCHRFVEGGVGSSTVVYQTKSPTGLPRIRYKCCQTSSSNHDCTTTINPNWALSFILTTLWLVSCIAAVFTPLLIKYSPNGEIQTNDTSSEGGQDYELSPFASPVAVNSGEIDLEFEEPPRRKPNQSDYITLNSSTPLEDLFEANYRCLFVCADFCPRLFRFLLFFILIPIVLIVSLPTYSFVAEHEVTLQRQAGIKTDFIQMCLNADILLICCIASYIFSCILMCIPLNLAAVIDESVLLVGTIQAQEGSCCVVCTALHCFPSEDLSGHRLLYDNMQRHLKFLFSLRFWKVLFSFSILPSRWLLHFFVYGKEIPSPLLGQVDETASYCVGGCTCSGVISTLMWILISPFWLIAFFSTACFLIFLMTPIGYFYACICFVPLVFLVQKLGNNIFTWTAFIVCFLLNLLSTLFLIEMITFSWIFIFKLIGFTLMGLVINIDYYIPYIVFVIAVLFYIQNFWSNLNNKYLKLKVLLFDECIKQHSVLLEEQASQQVQELVIKHSRTELPMIPKYLYDVVCKEITPFKNTFYSSLFNLSMILIFLAFVFASIMAFGKWAKLPSLTEAILTAVLSTLPKLLRYKDHAVKSMIKEKTTLYSLEVHVARFVRKLRDGNPSGQD